MIFANFLKELTDKQNILLQQLEIQTDKCITPYASNIRP
ncbi:hypothetical protein HDE69_001631 [Pedobacter cryoconitis]|uniref:Uncharacterized protein n=1 Tax=Pedobacter cryoconitis TaxID=188932 RepID=A0A7W8YRZ2_9SPHI|nr:hypothetical protein [Pedobacter cryoconitis]